MTTMHSIVLYISSPAFEVQCCFSNKFLIPVESIWFVKQYNQELCISSMSRNTTTSKKHLKLSPEPKALSPNRDMLDVLNHRSNSLFKWTFVTLVHICTTRKKLWVNSVSSQAIWFKCQCCTVLCCAHWVQHLRS